MFIIFWARALSFSPRKSKNLIFCANIHVNVLYKLGDLFTIKKTDYCRNFFTRNSVKNILSIIVNIVRDIFARFPRAWSSRISLNANQFSINCLCKGNYFQKIMIEKLVYQNFVHREIKSARIRTHVRMDTNELSKMNALNFA